MERFQCAHEMLCLNNLLRSVIAFRSNRVFPEFALEYNAYKLEDFNKIQHSFVHII